MSQHSTRTPTFATPKKFRSKYGVIPRPRFYLPFALNSTDLNAKRSRVPSYHRLIKNTSHIYEPKHRARIKVEINKHTSSPNRNPAPRGLTVHVETLSGSDQSRSLKGPLCGISTFLSIILIWSIVLVSGERPPWTQRIVSSMRAAIVRRSKTLQQFFQGVALPYLVMHSS